MVSFAAVIRVVTQWAGEGERYDPDNACEGDYFCHRGIIFCSNCLGKPKFHALEETQSVQFAVQRTCYMFSLRTVITHVQTT